MKNYTIKVSVDEDKVRKVSGDSDLEGAILTEAGWMQESGIYAESVEEVSEEKAPRKYNATTEELVSELEKRYDNLYPIREASEVLASRDKNNYVEGYIQIHASDMIDNDYEGFLDFISEKLVGSDLLMDVNYEVVAQAKKMFLNELILKVTGDVSTIIEEEM